MRALSSFGMRVGTSVGLLLLSLITLFPFFWSFILASHNRETIFGQTLPLFLGDDFLKNYTLLQNLIPYWRAMGNSLMISCMGTLFSLLFCSMAGFTLALHRFHLRKLFFLFMLLTMMIPPVVSLVPYYLTIQYLGLLNTHIAVWLPFTATPLGIFLIRQYVLRSIPLELIEAAKLDGASSIDLFVRVALPLLKPALATLGIIQFVFFWNNFLSPLVVLTEQDQMVLPVALRSLQNHPNAPWGAVMVGTSFAFIPIMLVYAFSSNRIISGLTSGAVKG